ncbi:hypothetical protein Zmor_025701 [Zophobas morio]|uniref:Uncharacterized protein n=1 Tax=Zophobas morio TaxID=2755281 RepID=A0AA38HTY8_9CUCU|nr:hypothetical protein Zmor_025701 [Zophobas morio]
MFIGKIAHSSHVGNLFFVDCVEAVVVAGIRKAKRDYGVPKRTSYILDKLKVTALIMTLRSATCGGKFSAAIFRALIFSAKNLVLYFIKNNKPLVSNLFYCGYNNKACTRPEFPPPLIKIFRFSRKEKSLEPDQSIITIGEDIGSLITTRYKNVRFSSSRTYKSTDPSWSDGPTMSKDAKSMIWDYLVFVIFVIASTFVAVYSRFFGPKEKTKADFVFAAGKVSMAAMMLSIARGTLGVRSFLGYPSELFYRGSTMWETLYGMVLAYPIVCFVFVPVYFSLGITSVYQYLDLRFKSRLVRCLASGTYIVRQLLNQGVTVFTPCVALNTVIGIPYWASICGITLVSIIFTILNTVKWLLELYMYKSDIGQGPGISAAVGATFSSRLTLNSGSLRYPLVVEGIASFSVTVTATRTGKDSKYSDPGKC